MVTCQSANQLKTPAKVSWAFKMVSQFGSLGYTIMGKTADLTVVQKTIIDTLHKEGKPQTFIAKEAGCSQCAVSKHVNRKLSGRKKCGRKRCTTNRENRSLMRIVKQNRIWVNFTRNGLRLGSRHQEPPHTDVSRNLATVVVFLLLSHSWTTDNVRGVLPGLRRRRTGLLPSGPKSSFQMRASFVFHLETKVLESGGRVEKLIAQVAWSPVLSFYSLWWFGMQCHLLVLVHCVFWKPTSLHSFTKKFEHFMLPSADQLFKDADFIFQQDLAPAHTAKSTKSWLNDHGVGVLDWPANSSDLNPIENLWGIVKRKMRIKGPFKPGHFMRFFWSDSYPILKRPGVNALRNAFETDINPIAQTTSGGGLGHIPDKTGQV